jgi:hypothetical protein
MNRTTISRNIAAAMLGTVLFASALPASSQPFGEHGRGYRAHMGQLSEADRAQLRARMQARVSARLDRLAARLEIRASQQDAWTAYRTARESLVGTAPQRPARDADAATVLRFRAEMAQRRAQHLRTMADATAKLQEVLDPNQRKVLDEAVRHAGPRARRGAHRRHDQSRGFPGNA